MSNIIRNRNALLGVATLASIGATACGVLDESGNDDWSEHLAKLEVAGELDTEYLLGTVVGSVRHDPQRIESSGDGDNNECYDASDMPFELEVNDSVELTTDENSPWFAIPLENLPEEVQRACRADVDGNVWVADTSIQRRQ